ncbi:MAG TPA: type II toxin-antitoxin system Phd/YefM family antitoxin [Rhizomicrobium sp.]|nr:type II toxin-antitoxin system Phd/YefM family antitoxin [Rhizomicrobium sp.]
MVSVGATTLVRKFGHYQDVALREPVAITSNGRERVVLISADEYHRLKRRDRRVLGLDDFSADDIAAIGRSEAPAETAQFDHEVK